MEGQSGTLQESVAILYGVFSGAPCISRGSGAEQRRGPHLKGLSPLLGFRDIGLSSQPNDVFFFWLDFHLPVLTDFLRIQVETPVPLCHLT